jgi:cell division protease FtsH
MVMRFGMSDAVGPVAVGDREHQVFLGREFAQHREVSDKTAELVDTEVKRVLDEAYERAREILQRDIDILHRMAKALLDRETLDRDEVELIVQGKELPAPEDAQSGGLDELLPRPRNKEKPASDGGGVLGTPPAEPAGA